MLALGTYALPVLADPLGQDETRMTKIQFTIGDTVLYATLDATAPGRDFAAMLPLTLTLTDYHNTEKVADLPRAIDRTGAPAAYAPKIGDITVYAPWGNLAIFYKPFQKSAGLIRLGQFDGPMDVFMQNGSIPVTIARVD